MKKVSVLMSVYNEELFHIKEAVESIVTQTFSEFEFIIVCDNPLRLDIISYLEELKKTDERVSLIFNDENLGLPNSLNKGLLRCSTDYVVRMDADDIATQDRVEKLFNAITNTDYDVVCSKFKYIDENGNQLQDITNFYSSKEIEKLLPMGNVIHHPTIIMKKKLVDSIGGYRNIPFAEDYDLWLRLYTQGCKFLMLENELLFYRIRNNSITLSNRKEQQLTFIYIRNLFIERLSKESDSHSENMFKNYLKREKSKGNKTFDHNQSYSILRESHRKKESGKYLSAIGLRCKVFINDRVYRKAYISKIKTKVYLFWNNK